MPTPLECGCRFNRSVPPLAAAHAQAGQPRPLPQHCMALARPGRARPVARGPSASQGQVVTMILANVPEGSVSSNAVKVSWPPEKHGTPCLDTNLPSPPAVSGNCICWSCASVILITIKLPGVNPTPLTIKTVDDPVPSFETLIDRGGGGGAVVQD